MEDSSESPFTSADTIIRTDYESYQYPMSRHFATADNCSVINLVISTDSDYWIESHNSAMEDSGSDINS